MTEYIEQKKKLFEDVLTQAYDHKKYIGFLRELLNDVELVAPNKQQIPYNTFSSAVEHYVYIGIPAKMATLLPCIPSAFMKIKV